jgi:hypothetical protein
MELCHQVVMVVEVPVVKLQLQQSTLSSVLAAAVVVVVVELLLPEATVVPES